MTDRSRVVWCSATPGRAGDVPGFPAWWRDADDRRPKVENAADRRGLTTNRSISGRRRGASAGFVTTRDGVPVVCPGGNVVPDAPTWYVGDETTLLDCPWPVCDVADVVDHALHRAYVEGVGVALVDGGRAAAASLRSASATATAARFPGGAALVVGRAAVPTGVLATRLVG